MKKRWIFFFFLAMKAFSQMPNNAFEKISTLNGLPSNEVLDIDQDEKGFLWVSTRRGLARYDGYDFRVIKGLEAPSTYCSYQKNALYFFSEVDGGGLIKLQTDSLKKEVIVMLNYKDSDPTNDHYENIFADSHARIWSTDLKNIKYFDEKRHKLTKFHLNLSNEDSQDNFSWAKFGEDKNGTLWAFTRQGTYRFDAKKDSLFLINKLSTACFFYDKAKNLFLLSNGKTDLTTFDPQSQTFTQKSFVALKSMNIRALHKSADGNIWIGTEKGIINLNIATEKVTTFSQFEEEPAQVNAIIEDQKNQILWFATNKGLWFFHEGRAFKTLILPKDLIKYPVVVTAFLEFPKEKWMFLGLSNQGLLRFDENSQQFRVFHLPKNIAINNLVRAKNGDILAATSQGVWVKKLLSSQLKLLFSNKPIRDIEFDNLGKLWILPESGVIQVIDYQTLTPKNVLDEAIFRESLKINNYHDLQLDKQGRMWCAAWFPRSFGVAFFDEKLRKFIEVAQPPFNATNYHFVGAFFTKAAVSPVSDKIWFSAGGGFNSFNHDGKLIDSVFTTEFPFHQHHIALLAVDKNETLWGGTWEGLHAFDTHKRTLKVYTEFDGLRSNNTSYALLADSENQLWIGQNNCVNVLNINELNANKQPNIPIITSMKIKGIEKNIFEKSLIFQRNENSLTFDFSTLNFEPATKISYRYKLNESDWQPLGNNHTLSFIDLEPDSYHLQIQAVDENNGGQSKILPFDFKIQPAYYETWWFKLLIISLLGAIALAFYRYRINQILQLQGIRENISRDLHDEIGASLSGIGMLSQIAAQKLNEAHPAYLHLQRIAEDAQNIGASVDDIIWSVNPKNDEISNLIARINRHASELLEAKDIDYQVFTKEIDENLKLSMQQRRDVFLIFKEALNNLLKYANCQKVVVEMATHKNILTMKISDDGKGFDSTKKYSGNGLKNMQQRAKNLGGNLTIISAIGKGTNLELSLPIH